MRFRFMLSACAAAASAVLLLATASPAEAREGRIPGQRPNLPNEQTMGTEHFLIHYTFRGDDAVAQTDGNGDGTPDYLALVAEALEYTWTVEIDQMGWPAPPPDNGTSGDDRIDVYLEDILDDGYAGYADSEGGFVGDNPNTPDAERRAAFSYLALDNDYAGLDSSRGETPIELMQATVAHEFNHILQSGLDSFEPHFWLYESTATWMEDEVYPDVNDGVFYLDDTFNQPDQCIVSEDGWYGNWLFMRMLSERHGSDIVRTIWEHAVQREGFDAMDQALAEYGTTLDAAVRDYGVHILLREYAEGQLYPAVAIEGTANQSGDFTPRTGVESLGVDFVRLSGSGLTDVSLNSASPAMMLRVVGIRGADADVIDAQGAAATLDLSAYDQAFALVQNVERITEEEDCLAREYSLRLSASSAAPTPIAAVHAAGNFGSEVVGPAEEENQEYEPPTGQPFTGSGAEFSTTAGDLEVSFTPLVPEAPPPGYEFDLAYVMTEEDFGENYIFYMPGGGESANYDYTNAAGNWLSIAESPSPYDTLDEWLTDIDYNSPGEYIDVEGVQVLMEDLSDESGIWFSATFIYDGLFFVVDSDSDQQSVIALIEAIVSGETIEVQPSLVPPTTVGPSTGPTSVPFDNLPDTSADDGLIAGFGVVTVAVCCSLLCLLAAVIGGAAFVLMRRRQRAL